MKKRTLAAILSLWIITAFLLGACTVDDEQPNTSTQTETTQSTETTQPEITLDSIRTEEFSDIPVTSLYYDTACYMRYYGIMEAPEGKFSPYSMATRTDGADAICCLTGKTMQEELTEQEAPLTRAQLAVMLYRTAEHLGYSTQTTVTELNFADGKQVAQDAREAVLWAVEKGLFNCFVGDKLLPNTAVSRLQLAQALVALKTLDPEDTLARQIWEGLPARSTASLAVKNHDAIQAAVDAAAEKYGAIGLQVAVVEKGIVTDTYAYGWATKDTDPMTADHKLRVASISKVAVGVAAQLLREEGVIDLDADISSYWDFTVKNPKHPNVPITIRSMLTHTSSIINAGDSTSREYSKVCSMLQSTDYSSGIPGDIGWWSYNNYAFAVLGMTLELASDRVLDDVLGPKLYTPMDMDAAFGSGDIKNTDMLATIYRYGGAVGRSVETQKQLHSNPVPGARGSYFAGGMTVSASDLAKLVALLAGNGRYEGVQLLQPESVELMESLHSNRQVPGGSYQALPMRYWKALYGREGIYFHTGSAYGVYNCACYDPVTGDGVVVLTTGASGSKDEYGIYKVCAEINQYIYDAIKS